MSCTQQQQQQQQQQQLQQQYDHQKTRNWLKKSLSAVDASTVVNLILPFDDTHQQQQQQHQHQSIPRIETVSLKKGVRIG